MNGRHMNEKFKPDHRLTRRDALRLGELVRGVLVEGREHLQDACAASEAARPQPVRASRDEAERVMPVRRRLRREMVFIRASFSRIQTTKQPVRQATRNYIPRDIGLLRA